MAIVKKLICQYFGCKTHKRVKGGKPMPLYYCPRCHKANAEAYPAPVIAKWARPAAKPQEMT